jgi:hypothetical protein
MWRAGRTETVVVAACGGAHVDADDSETAGTSAVARRVTVNLTPKSSLALDAAVGHTGYSRTDTINRALQFYAFIEEIKARTGGHLLIRSGDGDEQRVCTF